MQGYTEQMPEGTYQDAEASNQYQRAAQALHEAFDRRRGYQDEMEKLIGVRSLDQHPDGINRAVIALLGITNQLEVNSRIGWDTFVIGELMKYINGVGSTEDVMAAIAANRVHTVTRMMSVKDLGSLSE